MFDFKLRDKNQKEGFVLLELIFVVTFIGLLVSIVMWALNPIKILQDARDKQRWTDLQTLHDAMEQYALRDGQYPSERWCDSSIGSCDTACPCNPAQNDWDKTSSIWTGLVGGGWLAKLPKDPINNHSFYYYYEPDCNQGKCFSGTGGNGLCCGYYLGCNFESDSDGFVWVYTP